ncbi:MAG: ABC transporter permease [Nibricoccus sp.]
MRAVLILLRKDFAHFFRNKAAVSLTFAVPFAMICLFGQIFDVNGKKAGPKGIQIAVVNASDSPAASKLVDALKAEKTFRVITDFDLPDKTKRPLVEDDLRPMMRQPRAEVRFALVIPADLMSEDSFGIHLKILSNPRNDIETQTVNGILQKTIFSNVPELLGQSLQARSKGFLGAERFDQFNGAIAAAVSNTFGGDQAAIERQIASGDFGFGSITQKSKSADGAGDGGGGADIFSKIVRIEREQVVGANVKNAAATNLVGGWAIQFLLFALTSSVTSLFRERDTGIFQRLLSAPVTRAQILWGKFFYGVALGLLQLVALFAAGGWLYGVEVLPHLPLLVLVSVFAAAACTSFAMLVAAIAPNAEAAGALSTFIIMLMSALGGAWFPLSIMPVFLQQFSKLTLVYWSMEGFSAVLWAGQSFMQILPLIGILGGITALVMSVALWRFNRGRIFE